MVGLNGVSLAGATSLAVLTKLTTWRLKSSIHVSKGQQVMPPADTSVSSNVEIVVREQAPRLSTGAGCGGQLEGCESKQRRADVGAGRVGPALA